MKKINILPSFIFVFLVNISFRSFVYQQTEKSEGDKFLVPFSLPIIWSNYNMFMEIVKLIDTIVLKGSYVLSLVYFHLCSLYECKMLVLWCLSPTNGRGSFCFSGWLDRILTHHHGLVGTSPSTSHQGNYIPRWKKTVLSLSKAYPSSKGMSLT